MDSKPKRNSNKILKSIKPKRNPSKAHSPLVAIAMGSKTDLPTMREAQEALRYFGIDSQVMILSAHRTPDEVMEFAKTARINGFRVIIAGAGGAAHLPGMIAAHTELPVIGVPVCVGFLEGFDSLLSIVQMPRGIPVATVTVGNAWNAGILASQILGAGQGTQSNSILLDKVSHYKEQLRLKVLRNESAKNLRKRKKEKKKGRAASRPNS